MRRPLSGQVVAAARRCSWRFGALALVPSRAIGGQRIAYNVAQRTHELA